MEFNRGEEMKPTAPASDRWIDDYYQRVCDENIELSREVWRLRQELRELRLELGKCHDLHAADRKGRVN